MSAGTYVVAPDAGTWTRGIVRRVSPDARILYVELEGDSSLWRYSPDEVRVAGSVHDRG